MQSKLVSTGTSIFTIMSKMAADYGAINLSQGYPGFHISQKLIDLVSFYMNNGDNQYAPMPGLPQLRAQISQKVNQSFDCGVNADDHITVTSGATEAIYSTMTALIHAGDEVIYFEPAYDSYHPNILLNGGLPIPIKLNSDDFSIPWEAVEKKVTAKTKMIVINTPHNPSGAVLKKEDLERLYDIIRDKEIFVLSDEVYEHLIFDGLEHQSVLSHAGLREKSIAVFSFGKTFHATGWKMGYSVAPKVITDEIKKVHQFVVFSVSTPVQLAMTEFLKNPDHYNSLPGFYQKKRDLFLELMKKSRFKPLPSHGTYFVTYSYEGISDERDVAISQRFTKENGVASIPFSVFYGDKTDNKLLRFCFAKEDETLIKAADILCKI
ncbi:MAG: methionine aminotransferase [Cyclobacteriaceae bacterium]|jgi:methionine aminotransferase